MVKLCGLQDEMLRELRDRMEQLMHGAAARAAAEADAADDGSTLRQLRAELAHRDTLLQKARADVQQVRITKQRHLEMTK